MGKTANGQVVVTTHYADPYYTWHVNGQLYLPDNWAQDGERRRRAAIPESVMFETKPGIALALIDNARQAGVSFQIVVADSSYGGNPTFLEGLEARELSYVVCVASDFGVRLAAEVEAAAQQVPPAREKRGRPRKHPHPVQVAPLHRADHVVASQLEEAWQTIAWRMGTEGPLSKQFVAVRARRAIGDWTGNEGWLVGERPLPGKEGEGKYYWSDLSVTTPLARLVEVVHRRPSIERGYQDGKGFTGLDTYPARKWTSFHRHFVIDLLVLSWLALQRPPVENPVVCVEPQAVQSPDKPVFPLRT